MLLARAVAASTKGGVSHYGKFTHKEVIKIAFINKKKETEIDISETFTQAY